MSNEGALAKIIVADDEPIVRTLTTVVLERRGYQVSTATDGQEAIELFEDNPSEVDLVLTDVNMPRKTGVEVVREVKEIKPDQPVIVMTGNVFQLQDHLVGVPTLPKPFTAGTLLSAVEKELESPDIKPLP